MSEDTSGDWNPVTPRKRIKPGAYRWQEIDLEKRALEKESGELQLKERRYYSTSSGFKTDGRLTPRRLLEDDEGGSMRNKRSLNKERIQSPIQHPIDLLAGFRPTNPKLKNFRSKERMDILLKGLIKHEMLGSSKFVCQRGLLIQVGLTPFCDLNVLDQGIKIAAEMVGSTLYMYMYPTIEDVSKAATDTKPDNYKQKSRYIGLMFEQYMTGQARNSDKLSDPSQEFGALVKATLGGHELIISGEIDGMDESEHLVELKSHKKPFADAATEKKRQWLLQCHLLGVDTLVLGTTEKNPSETVCKCVSVTPHSVPVESAKMELKTSLAAIHKFLTNVYAQVEGHLANVGGQMANEVGEGRKIYVVQREKKSFKFHLKESKHGDTDQFIDQYFIDILKAETPCAQATESTSSLHNDRERFLSRKRKVS